MSVKKVIKKILRLQGILKITGIKFRNRDGELHLDVRPFRNGCRCPECNRRGKIVRQLPTPRTWRDIRVAGWTVFFHYTPREIHCPCHGRVQEEIPWAESYTRVTYRLEFLVLTLSQLMTQKAAAEVLSIPSSTFSDILHRSIKRLRSGHRIRGLKSIGVDEISYRKGMKFATIVYDLDKSRVVWVGKGKGRETIDAFFKSELTDYQKKKIKWACCDMSETYIGALKEHCPKAKLVLDRFHIVKKLHEAVDEVRKEEWRKVAGDDEARKAYKGLRWLLFKRTSNRTEAENLLLRKLKKGNRRIYRASVLKDEFDQFWEFGDTAGAEIFLRKWGTTTLKSRLEPLQKFVRTIRKHTANIITFIDSHLTNAVAEGLNRIIKIVKNRASGFKGLDPFIDLIYLTVGDVDIPGQIPKRFRTL